MNTSAAKSLNSSTRSTARACVKFGHGILTCKSARECPGQMMPYRPLSLRGLTLSLTSLPRTFRPATILEAETSCETSFIRHGTRTSATAVRLWAQFRRRTLSASISGTESTRTRSTSGFRRRCGCPTAETVNLRPISTTWSRKVQQPFTAPSRTSCDTPCPTLSECTSTFSRSSLSRTLTNPTSRTSNTSREEERASFGAERFRW
mmetsp:Transcript_442/g.1515  ORF Transcript_442/g.1515 Transcript_442/m.1515 type:complete len:206 (+) Transcript_442:1352-1969(+)